METMIENEVLYNIEILCYDKPGVDVINTTLIKAKDIVLEKLDLWTIENLDADMYLRKYYPDSGFKIAMGISLVLTSLGKAGYRECINDYNRFKVGKPISFGYRISDTGKILYAKRYPDRGKQVSDYFNQMMKIFLGDDFNLEYYDFLGSINIFQTVYDLYYNHDRESLCTYKILDYEISELTIKHESIVEYHSTGINPNPGMIIR